MHLASFFKLGLVLSGMALIGGGCASQTQRGREPSNAPPTARVIATSSPQVVATSSESRASQLISLEGDLPRLGPTSLLLTLGAERITGRYETSKGITGMIYGTVTSSRDLDPIQFSLLRGDEDVAGMVGSYSDVTGEFKGDLLVPPSTAPTPITLTRKVIQQGAVIQLKKIEREKTFRRGISCHSSLEYPVVVANDFISQERATDINRQIRSFLGETATSTLESISDGIQADCIDMQTKYGMDLPEDADPSGTGDYEDETTTLVTRNERGLLSLVYSNYSYTGGAHPNSALYSQTFDLTTGKELNFADLVRDDARPLWIRREQQALLMSEYGLNLFDQDEAERLAKGTLKGEAASSTAAYQSIEAWYLQGNSLNRYYQSYEIAPYSSGQPTTEHPFTAWKDLAVPGVERWFK